MFFNYFKVAWRNLLKFRAFTFMNIAGLAIGLSCCLLTVQYIREETKFDQHHIDKENIYRVSTDFMIGERQFNSGTTPPALSIGIKKDFPEIKESARVFKAPSLEKFLLKVDNRSFFEEKGLYADSTFFRILTYDFVAGDPQHALDQPYSIVISTKLAEKLFPNEDALGNTVQIESLWGAEPYQIKGIFNKETYRSHIDGDFYISAMSGNVGRRFYRLDEWVGNNLFYTYVQLQEGIDPQSLEAKLPAWLDSYAADRLKELGFQKRHYLDPVSDIYLYSGISTLIGPNGNITYLYILGSIALLVLLIASINFMNLATAKATTRSREVGVRKVVGASKAMLLKQFLGEAFLYTFIAILLAYILAELSVPMFNQLIDKQLSFNLAKDLHLIPILLAGLLLTTTLVGSYPAIYLSSFNPINIIKGTISDRFSAKHTRKALVVLQFVISIALIQGVLVINSQMNYIKNKHLGFNTTQKIIIPNHSPNAVRNYPALKQELLRDSRVLEIGGSSTYPGIVNVESSIVTGSGQILEEGKEAYMAWIEPEYLELMEFELKEGRIFDENRLADTVASVVITERLAKGLGYDLQTAVGKEMHLAWRDFSQSYQIIGVLGDFHSTALYNEIRDHAFYWSPASARSYLIAQVQTDDMTALLTEMEKSWQKINPEEPFEYHFLDQQIQMNYQRDQKMGSLVSWATLLAILISCIGLLGLAAFAAERRAKEIGVRKILGASVVNIFMNLSKDFIRLVLIGFVIATPIAWYAMSDWLESFFYHIGMPVWAFGLAGGIALLIALLTICWQTLRAATADPIHVLRQE